MRDDGLLTVEGLIDILRQFNPERVVIVAKDPEGNGFSPLSEVTTASYVPLHPWDGEIREENASDVEIDKDQGIPCIILDPIV